MDSGSYAACAGLMARSQQLDLAAQDLANAGTPGYRSQRATFQAVLARAGEPGLNDWSAAVNSFGVLGGSRISRTPGNLAETGNPLDLGIEGNAFFVVQSPSGPQYTRNGKFTVSSTGMLTTADGYPVMGEQGPVRVPGGRLSISADGTLSVEGALAGKLRLVEFSPSTPLQAEGSAYYSAPVNSALAARSATIRQGMLESSNVNPVTSAVQLISLQRTAQMLQTALTTFHSNFDRIAVEEIPKV